MTYIKINSYQLERVRREMPFITTRNIINKLFGKLLYLAEDLNFYSQNAVSFK